MTITEKNNLALARQHLSEYLDFDDISDSELFDIIVSDCIIDLDDFNIESIINNREEIIEWLEDLHRSKEAKGTLQTLFCYIDDKGYDLETFLNILNYKESNFDPDTLNSQELEHIIEEIEYFVSELDYQIETDELAEQLQAIENSDPFDPSLFHRETNTTFNNDYATTLLIEKEELLKKIKSLTVETKKVELKHTLEELKIIQAKEFLSPKELSILYPNMSIETQKTFRGRIHDPLPYQQLKRRGKITYIRKEVDIWRMNNNK